MLTLDDVYERLGCELDPAFAIRARFILERLWALQPERILDCGCGRGFYTSILADAPFVRSLTGLDLNACHLRTARAITPCRGRERFVVGSLTELPFPDASFDCVICSEVLEHIPDDTRAVDEIWRVLRPGGTVLVSVPCKRFPFLWDPANWLLMRLFGTHVPAHIHWLAGIWADHVRLYDRAELESLLGRRCRVHETQSIVRTSWPFSHFLLYGIGKNLVERAGFSTFNRFSTASSNPLTRSLAWLLRLPLRFETLLPGGGDRGVIIVAAATRL